MQLQTRMKVQNWARRLPPFFIAMSVVALVVFGAAYLLAPQTMPTLYGYASAYLGLVFFLFMLSLDSEIDSTKVDHFNGHAAFKGVMLALAGAAINIPIMLATYANEGIGYAPMIGAMAGIVAGKCLQSVLLPLYADERRRTLLNRFESMHLAYIWETDAPLPAAQQQLVDRVEAEGLTMSLEELEEAVDVFDDFIRELDEQTA